MVATFTYADSPSSRPDSHAPIGVMGEQCPTKPVNGCLPIVYGDGHARTTIRHNRA